MANKRLAKKGRYGDTEIRNVAGRKSHVNKQEAKAIDLYGKLGERLVQEEGAGTRNPETGLDEYHWSLSYHTNPHPEEIAAAKEESMLEQAGDRFDPGAYSAAISNEGDAGGEAYLSRIGITKDQMESLSSSFTGEDFEGLRGQRDLGYASADLDVTQATNIQAEAERGQNVALGIGSDTRRENLRSAGVEYGIGMGGVQETERAAGAAYRLGARGVGIGRERASATYGLGMEAQREARRSAGEQYGLGAREVGLGYERAGSARELGLAGTAEARRAAGAGYDIGMMGTAEARRAAESQYGIGMAGAAESERAAQAQFEMGTERAATGARRSLFDVRGQTASAAGRTGLARSGQVAATGRRAQKGAFEDYTAQQKQLAEAKGSAMAQVGLGRASLAEARRGALTGADISAAGLGETRTGALARAGLSERGIEAEYGFAGTARDIGMDRLGAARGSAMRGASLAERGLGADLRLSGMESNLAMAGLGEARTGALAGADLSRRSLQEGRTSAQNIYGEGGLQARSLHEDWTAGRAASGIAFAGAIGGADIARTQADLTYGGGRRDLTRGIEDEFYEDLYTCQGAVGG